MNARPANAARVAARGSLGGLMLLLVALAIGCATVGPPRPRLSAVSSAKLAKRVALGDLDGVADRHDDPVAVLREAAALSAKLGNRDEAKYAAREALAHARTRVGLAALAGERDPGAKRSLAEVAEFALELGDAVADYRLVLDAAQDVRDLDAHREALERAAVRGGSFGRRNVDAVWAALSDSPRARAQIHRQQLIPGEDLPPLGAGETKALGVEAADLQEFSMASAADENDRAKVASIADALLAADRMHVEARIVRMLLGLELEDDDHLRDALTPGYETPIPAIARLELLQAEHPQAAAIELAIDALLLRVGLFGDTLQRLAAARDAKLLAAPEAAELARQLEAMARLEAGDVEAYRAWRKAAGAGGSVYLRQFELDTAGWEGPQGYEDLGEAAAREIAERAPARLPADDALSLYLEQRRPRARRRFGRVLWEAAWWDAELVELCTERELDGEGCRELLDEIYYAFIDSEVDDPTPTLLGLGETRHFASSWLDFATWIDAASLENLAAGLDPYRGTRLEATTAFQIAAVRTELAQLDHAAARRRLEEYGAMLPSNELLFARAVLADGPNVEPRFAWLGAVVDLPQTRAPAAEPGEIDDAFPDTRAGRLLRAQAAAWAGLPAHARDQLAPMLEEFDGRAGADLAARLGWFADQAGDEATRARAMSRLEQLEPNGFALAYLRGRAAEGAGDPSSAHGHYRAALSRRPGSYVLENAVVRTMPASVELAGLRRYAELAGQRSDVSVVLAKVDDGLLSTMDEVRVGLAALRASPEEAEKLGAAGAKIESVAYAVLNYLAGQMTLASDAKEAAGLARRAAAYAALNGQPRWRVDRMWFHLIAGEPDEVLALASLDTDELDPLLDDDLAQWARLAKRGHVSPELAWDLWREDEEDETEYEAIQAFTRAPPEDPVARSLLCTRLTNADRLQDAIPHCIAAFEPEDAPGGVAVALAYLVLNAGDQTKEAGLEPAEFFRKASARAKLAAVPVWQLNYSVWLDRQGRSEEAAHARTLAYAADLSAEFRGEPDQEQARQLPYRGATLRLQLEVEGRRSASAWSRYAIVSLQGADLVAAQAYAARLMAAGDARHAEKEKEEQSTEGDDGAAQTADSEDEQERAAREKEDETWRKAERTGYFVLGSLELIEADLDAGHLDHAGVVELMDLVIHDGQLAMYEQLRTKYEGSSFYDVLLLEAVAKEAAPDDRLPIARRLIERHPTNPVVILDALPALIDAGDYATAADALVAARKRHPDHRWLAQMELPEEVSGVNPDVPGWVRRPESFDRRLAEVSLDDIEKLRPTRRFYTVESAEAYVPADLPPHPSSRVGSTDEEGRWTFVGMEARASRCEGAACAAPVISLWRKRHWTVLWSRPITLPAGEATEVMASNSEEVISTIVLPTGGNVFTIVTGAPHALFESHLAASRLLRESFRPLDWVLASDHAEQLRAASPGMPSDAARLAARRELAEASEGKGKGCPVDGSLAKAKGAAAKSALLLDLFLVSPDARMRRRLVGCTRPQAPEAASFALAALLDGDAHVHDFGVEAARAHADRVLADASAVLLGRHRAPVSIPDYYTDPLPRFGVLEVMAALPDAQSKQLAARLLESGDPNNQAVGIATNAIVPERVDHATLREWLARDDPGLALLAARALLNEPDAEDLEALRRRMDAIEKAADDVSRNLLSSLAYGIASQLERKDKRRLARAAAKVSSAKEAGDEARAEQVRERLAELPKLHAKGLKNKRRRREVDDDDVARWLSREDERGKPRSRQQLQGDALATMLPGRRWRLARASNPGLFATSLRALVERLHSGNPSDAYTTQSLVRSFLVEGGFSVFSEGSGLDLSRPVECASPVDSNRFVCSARLRDPSAMLATLAKRRWGDDTGLTIPLSMATEVGYLPMALAMAPALLHDIVFPKEDVDEPAKRAYVEERVRGSVEVAGHELHRYSTVRVGEGELSIDTEVYLIVGDRMLAFTDTDLARVVLTNPPPGETSLADDPEFRRIETGWSASAGLQAADLGGAGLDGLGAIATEMVFASNGLRFEYEGEVDADPVDVRGVASLLPDGAVSRMAFGLGSHGEELEELHLERAPVGAGPLPPVEVLSQAHTIAFGWYPEPGQGLWEAWVAVIDANPEVRRAATKAGLDPKGKKQPAKGVVAALHRNQFVLASNAELLARAVARPGATSSPDTMQVGEGHLSGQRAAAVMRAMGARDEVDDDKGPLLRVMGAMVALIGDVSFDASYDPTTHQGTLSAQMALSLARDEDQIDVIDRWLSSPAIANAAPLPRRLSERELEAPLVWEIEVAAPEDFVRAIPSSAGRIRAEVVGPTRMRLTVSPEDTGQRPGPLPDKTRKKLLASSGNIRSHAPKITKVVKKIIDENDPPAERVRKIVEWVKGRMTYELRPDATDAVTVLDLGRGDCTEHALLAVTLLRAAGIPAEIRDGMAASGTEMVAHAWVGWHDGERWHEADPTEGVDHVGSGHLEIPITEVLALISLGKFEVVEIRPARGPSK